MPTIKKISLNGTTYDLGGGLTEDVKQASLQIAEKVAYIDEHGQDYYDDLYDALYPPIPATSVTLSSDALSFASLGATQTLTATILPSDSTDTVSWSSSNTSVATVSNGVVTSVAYGSATITATAGSVSATCSVVIAPATLVSISATYTQSGTVYDTDSLDSLKADLVVTATFSDSSTDTVPSADYTLNGTLSAGTSTITVDYGGKTAQFTVTVTDHNEYHLASPITNNSKQLLGVTPFAEGKAFTILFDFSVTVGGSVTNGTRFYGIDGSLWSVGFGMMYAATTAGGSTSPGIFLYAKSYGVKICEGTGLVKNVVYRLAVTYDPNNLLVSVRFKGGAFDVTGSIQLTEAPIYSGIFGLNTGTYTKEIVVRQLDIYMSVLSSSEIDAFLNA